jgi:hypothetical protein
MLNEMKSMLNMKTTENGATAYSSTLNEILDMFAFGAAYRQRSDADVIALFQNALLRDATLAMKCLFWIRDVRGGAGERRFFRVAMKWLAKQHPDIARRNLVHVPEYGRFDDLYVFVDTPLQDEAMTMLARQLISDMVVEFPSLAGKWAKSCNASSKESRRLGEITRSYMNMSPREYRRVLSSLRERLNVLERLMSGKRFDEIDFSKLPSVAGMRYSHCFSTREELKERYAEFMANADTKVNANTLFPYDCAVKAARVEYRAYGDTEREAVNKFWASLPDYIGDNDASNFMCVCDTSGSMTWGCNNPAPIDVATSLSIYFAERAKGPFHNHYISFSSRPQLIEITGRDFVEKVNRIRHKNLCENTNLEAVFDMLLTLAKRGVPAEDFVKNLFIISDMEIDQATNELYRGYRRDFGSYDRNTEFKSLMERIRAKWEENTRIPFPKLYYWNVNARNNTVLDLGPDVSYISGANPSILKQVLSGKTGWELCLEALLSERYAPIQ